MSEPIVCNGCGGRLTVPDDYTRNKMQCPECGVMCTLPPRTATKEMAKAPQPILEPRFEEDDEPAAAPMFAKAPISQGKGPVACQNCGELVRPSARKAGKQAKCPVCGVALLDPIGRIKQKPSTPVPPPPDEFAGTTIDNDPDSGNPYGTADPGARRCPECTEKLAPAVAVCVRCGFDLRLGRKLVKEYQRLEISWTSGMSLATRVVLFLLCQAAALTAVVAGYATLHNPLHEEIATFALSWMVYTAMTGFLLGTYDYFHLKRSKSGKLNLTRTWRIAFWPLPAGEIDLGAYFSVASGAGEYANCWDWLIFCILLSPGIIPALLYWYFAIHKTEYFVGLCGEHDHMEEKVYRGWDKQRMLEIQQTLRDAMTA